MRNTEVYAAAAERRSVMRRASALVRLSCVAVLLFTSGCAIPAFVSGAVYHQNPSTVREQYESWLMFAHLGGALLSIAEEQFDVAGQQLDAVDVARAHLPPGMAQLAARYMELCRQLAGMIEQVFDSLDAAGQLLSRNDLAEGGRVLAECRVRLGEAQQLLEVLDGATTEAFTLLRRSGGGMASQLNEARSALDAALALLLQLTDDYERRLGEMEEEATAKQSLRQPQLSARLDRESAWVGETLTLSGSLRLEGVALLDRALVVMLDGVDVGTARTDSTGGFTHRLTLPFEYVPKRSVRIGYSPEGGDLNRVLPVTSDEMVVTVRFHESTVSVDAPSLWHPGYPVLLAGEVVSAGTTERRQVDILWRGEPVGGTVTGPMGEFRCSIALPGGTQLGTGSLQVVVARDDGAATAPGRLTCVVEVSRVAPLVELHVAPLLLVPVPSPSLPRRLLQGEFAVAVPVESVVSSSLPLGSVAMMADWGGQPVRWEQREGAFAQEVPLRMSVWSMGVHDVTVRAAPQEPWHQPVESRATLLVVNLLVPAIWLASVGIALSLAIVLRRLRREMPAMELASAQLRQSPAAATHTEHFVVAGRAGPRLLVLRLYYRAVVLLQTVLGVAFRPDMTLREYQTAVARLIPGVRDVFFRLTSLGEHALYAGREPVEADIRTGTELLQSLYQSDELRLPDAEEEGQ